ncbi:MAG: WapI family immunity protein [Acidimicrobiales bacterium]
MELADAGGNELGLSIVGYRDPDETVDPWNSNALLVSVRVVSPHGRWEVVDPCLTTWEAARLASWLTTVAVAPERAPACISEPNLTAWARGRLERTDLRFCFELERRPPWTPSVAGAADLCVDLDVATRDVLDAASSLRADLARFPRRGEDPTL